MGAFVEELEPQVRDAVLALRAKGYNTASSGFYGENGEFQSIDGHFKVGLVSRRKLRSLGVSVEGGWAWSKYAAIQFWPREPDLDEMRATWDHVAQTMPDRGHQAAKTSSAGATRFRLSYTRGKRPLGDGD